MRSWVQRREVRGGALRKWENWAVLDVSMNLEQN